MRKASSGLCNANHRARRTRLSAARTRSSAPVLPTGQPDLRNRRHADHVARSVAEWGSVFAEPVVATLDLAAAPQPCADHPRRQLPAARQTQKQQHHAADRRHSTTIINPQSGGSTCRRKGGSSGCRLPHSDAGVRETCTSKDDGFARPFTKLELRATPLGSTHITHGAFDIDVRTVDDRHR